MAGDHARYVRLCLEFEMLGNGNHYVSNLLGLAATARGLPGLSSPSCEEKISRRFEREAIDDGPLAYLAVMILRARLLAHQLGMLRHDGS